MTYPRPVTLESLLRVLYHRIIYRQGIDWVPCRLPPADHLPSLYGYFLKTRFLKKA